jgi:hypothetical protein
VPLAVTFGHPLRPGSPPAAGKPAKATAGRDTVIEAGPDQQDICIVQLQGTIDQRDPTSVDAYLAKFQHIRHAVIGVGSPKRRGHTGDPLEESARASTSITFKSVVTYEVRPDGPRAVGEGHATRLTIEGDPENGSGQPARTDHSDVRGAIPRHAALIHTTTHREATVIGRTPASS